MLHNCCGSLLLCFKFFSLFKDRCLPNWSIFCGIWCREIFHSPEFQEGSLFSCFCSLHFLPWKKRGNFRKSTLQNVSYVNYWTFQAWFHLTMDIGLYIGPNSFGFEPCVDCWYMQLLRLCSVLKDLAWFIYVKEKYWRRQVSCFNIVFTLLMRSVLSCFWILTLPKV